MLNYIKNNNIELVIIDIDGTIKDLYTEHTKTLKKALYTLCYNKLKRVKFALFLNKIGMSFFKNGCLPTNTKMQSILLCIMSIVCFTNYKELKKLYYSMYPQTPIYFEDIKGNIIELSKHVKILFASTNPYTLNVKENIQNVFCVESPNNKLFKNILKEKEVHSQNVLVIGDNFFDDYIPAKCIGMHVKIVNQYNSKLKETILKLLKS